MVKRNSFFVVFFIFSIQISAVSPLGLFVPYDLNNRGERQHKDGVFQGSFFVEKGYKVKGFDIKGSDKNVLQVFDEKQNVTALYVSGTSLTVPLSTSVTTALVGGLDTKNGNFSVSGNYSAAQCAFGGSYSFGRGFIARVYAPVYSVSLSQVEWKYAGDRTSFVGATMAELLKDFEQEAKTLFDLNVNGWNQAGIGDLAFILDWERDFVQHKDLLRNVRPTLRIGVTLPTGAPQNTMEFGSVPLGADGSVTIPFGGGMRADLGSHAQIGFNAQFWYIWGKTKLRRIKTSFYQTELLLPTVTNTAKQFGMIQNFSMHGTLLSWCRCFSLQGFYEYVRKGEDILTPVDTKYGYDVINDHSEDAATGLEKGQKSLDESTCHSFTLKLSYDHHYAESQRKITPQASLFWKTSFYGSYTSVASSVGAQLAIDF